jgi:hypothetical protein
VNKVFIMALRAGSRGRLKPFVRTAQRSAAKHQNNNHDQENEAERASANIDGIGQNRR